MRTRVRTRQNKPQTNMALPADAVVLTSVLPGSRPAKAAAMIVKPSKMRPSERSCCIFSAFPVFSMVTCPLTGIGCDAGAGTTATVIAGCCGAGAAVGVAEGREAAAEFFSTEIKRQMMNVPIALTIFLLAFQVDDALSPLVPAVTVVAKAIQTVVTVGRLIPCDSLEDAIVMKPRGGSRKKEKAPQFPGIPKSDEPLVEVFFCIVSLIILIILWCIHKANGGS
jgi:hypothetical protein